MLARGQVNAPTVLRETTAELVNNPRNALALRARSGAYYVSSESDQGKRDAEEVERLLASATSAEEYEARCYARWRLGKPDLAVSDCTRAIELNRGFVWPYHNRANAYNDKRDYVNAVADWNKAIEIDSKFAPAYNNRGVYYTNNTRDYDRALSDLSKAVEIDPQYAAAYSARGNAYVYKGDYDHAIADFNKTMDLDPRDARPYNYRGHVYFYKQDYSRAIADYNKAIELNPRFAWAYDNRGNAYYYQGQKDRALADFNEAIRIDPQWSWAYQDRGNVYYDRKDFDRAIAEYDKAIELNPQLAWAYNGRGLSYYYKGISIRRLSITTKRSNSTRKRRQLSTTTVGMCITSGRIMGALSPITAKQSKSIHGMRWRIATGQMLIRQPAIGPARLRIGRRLMS